MTVESPEIKEILVGILQELRSIGAQLERQDQRLKLLEEEDHSLTRDKERSRERQLPTPTPPVWSPVLAEIRKEGPSLPSQEDVIYVYENDLIGTSLAKFDENYYAPGPQLSISEQETWTSHIGELWRIPVDGRLPLRFQQYWLLHPGGVNLPGSQRLSAHAYLEQVSSAGFQVFVTDYFDDSTKVQYNLDKHWSTAPVHHGIEDSRKIVNCSSGLWRRIIRLRGLEFSEIPLIRGLPGHNGGAKIIDDYRLCRRVSGTLPAWIRFHVTFYEIRASPKLFDGQRFAQKARGRSKWREGVLHSDKHEYWPRQHLVSGSGERSLAECAYTVAGLSTYYRGLECPRDYWTLIELRPDSLPASYDNLGIPAHYKCDILEIVLLFAGKALSTILIRWAEVLEFFDHVISEKNAFLDPNHHDSLLSDDETFSRSKKYFWAITTLKELDESLSDNIIQIKLLGTHQASDEVEAARKSDLKNARDSLSKQLDDFEQVAARLREKRQEALDLRDGLFSASAVMESRAATRLGENVKLLTLVSVFFLPLSFCMSVWSVNTLFSLRSLAITTPIVGLSTYIIVLNINHMVELFHSIYNSFVRSTVESMKDDPDKSWVERARAFEKISKPRPAEGKPSAWLLFQYTVRKTFRPAKGSLNDKV